MLSGIDETLACPPRYDERSSFPESRKSASIAATGRAVLDGMRPKDGSRPEPPGVPPRTAAHRENSEVLLPGSVAVAVMHCPRGTVTIKLRLKPASPDEFVVTCTEPRNVCPSPYPEGSGCGLTKNSRWKVVRRALL